jgi:prolyl-tRNA synthetase
MADERLPRREEDFSEWYNQVVLRAELADYSPVRGCMVIRPLGYAIWENIQRELDRRIKATGHLNAYFPLFIPMSFLTKEAEHVEGFAPEVAVVTRGGGEDLAEPLVIRPTSEAIIGDSFARWIHSWRDLPLLINQWANVVRWEMRTRPFLRTTEFLWQEGHTAHATEREAQEETLRMLDIYERVCEEYLAVPVLKGYKSRLEKFPGADRTYTVEGLMQDGKALQMGTSHNLGQNFAKAFEIQFQDTDGQRKHVWTTSWGLSTRTIGALIMAHGDDKGIVLPPRVAPIQAVVVPIFRTDAERASVVAEGGRIVAELKSQGVRGRLDDRDMKPGPKFFEWEQKGVPVRLELGPRDLAEKKVVVVRRDDGSKSPAPIDGLAKHVTGVLEAIQRALLDRARKFRETHTHRAATMAELTAMLDKGGFVEALVDGTDETELAIKDKTKATIRIVLEDGASLGKCVLTGKPATRRALFAIAY